MLFFAIISYVCAVGVVVAVVSLIVIAFCKIFNKGDLKIALIAAILFVITVCIALSPAGSRAEELPNGFYYRVVFIDEQEDIGKELLLHGDDANHIWDWYEEYPSDDEEFSLFEFDKELSNLALCWAQENSFFVQLYKEDRIVRGRIVVLTMWEATGDELDDEVVDVYYSEFITD